MIGVPYIRFGDRLPIVRLIGYIIQFTTRGYTVGAPEFMCSSHSPTSLLQISNHIPDVRRICSGALRVLLMKIINYAPLPYGLRGFHSLVTVGLSVSRIPNFVPSQCSTINEDQGTDMFDSHSNISQYLLHDYYQLLQL